jgi:hypothetical protein
MLQNRLDLRSPGAFLLSTFLLLVAGTGSARAQLQLYSYGTAAGDTALSSYNSTVANDTYAQVSLTGAGPSGTNLAIPFYGQTFNSLYVDDCGAVSFNQALTFAPGSSDLPEHLPTNLGALIAPFWDDVDTQAAPSGPANGKVWYRTALDGPTLTAIGQEVASDHLGAGVASFNPTFAEVVTWGASATSTTPTPRPARWTLHS